MAFATILVFHFLLLAPVLIYSSHHVEDPESVVQQVQKSIIENQNRRKLGYYDACGTNNPIDDCWRCDPNWENNRKRLAECAIGFGRRAIGGKDGKYYMVIDSSDDPVNPKPGTLRHAVIQQEPLWIIFKHDMVIKLKMDLLMNSFKTIDGRGVNVHIAEGPCIRIQEKTNIIIHGIHIHHCVRGGSGYVSDSPNHRVRKERSDGDGITIYGAAHIWVDHCSLSNCFDGLIDVVHGSTAVTISNNYMTRHNKVMLFGHSDSYEGDKNMQATIAFNHFGEGLGGRMPRCRFGYFHVVNNDYTHWQQYAIGGSSSPTIFSQGNRFLAPDDDDHKEITKHFYSSKGEWENWNWRSEGDLMLNGAYFTPSGAGASSSTYAKASSMSARPPMLVASMTAGAGVLRCKKGYQCYY
ncbi:putative pectate lyase [Medicago truncatula]|uniref:Pectate lyase n=1 Tax=Medicago truncatula TaxID=3880 RepID=G7J2L6_MEDTR|nr:probable pectate lyase 5 [Medicago truncatula]AES72123.2 pectate lyase family protein [Medicago truncatula]RHN69313.1 putative pectate lyase [Medicago truncatula]